MFPIELVNVNNNVINNFNSKEPLKSTGSKNTDKKQRGKNKKVNTILENEILLKNEDKNICNENIINEENVKSNLKKFMIEVFNSSLKTDGDIGKDEEILFNFNKKKKSTNYRAQLNNINSPRKILEDSGKDLKKMSKEETVKITLEYASKIVSVIDGLNLEEEISKMKKELSSEKEIDSTAEKKAKIILEKELSKRAAFAKKKIDSLKKRSDGGRIDFSKLNTIQNNNKDNAYSCAEYKFICTANIFSEEKSKLRNCYPSKFYVKDAKKEEKSEVWMQEISDIKKQLSLNLEKEVRNKFSSLKERDLKESWFKKGFDEFKTLNEELKGDTIESNFKVIEDFVDKMDKYRKYNSAIKSDQDFFESLSKIYMDVAAHSGIYYSSKQYYEKEINIKGEKTVDFKLIKDTLKDLSNSKKKNFTEENIINSLRKNLQEVVDLFYKKSEEVSKTEQTENDNPLSEEDIEQLISYLKKSIFIHKNLSAKRFVSLYNSHKKLSNRINYAFEKLDKEKDKNLINEFIENDFSPKVNLVDTRLHRKPQAKHDPKREKTTVTNHTTLDTINPYLHYLSAESPLSMTLLQYQCAHVIPFPALYVRRGEGKAEIKKFGISNAFLQNPEEKKLKADIDKLFDFYKSDKKKYLDNAIELIMKLSLEENSETFHLPGLFNQEIDGASEKYVVTDNKEIIALTEEMKKEQEKTVYTEKLYKYMISKSVYELIKKNKKISYKDVMRSEQLYHAEVKRSVAKRIKNLISKEKNVQNIISVISLCNVFYGLKKAEKRKNCTLEEGDQDFLESLKAVKDKWLENIEKK